ncbi:hypothetical protein A0H81_05133 [Grifola frondosa]|uniref:Uncharacterized protein n=1 Tax=Grifola frondosa TaxID=5627 RepID=A0A1C7MDN4_GRIFR|nr:hypothetical protein A0H81_05133 [Grifola frondosa]
MSPPGCASESFSSATSAEVLSVLEFVHDLLENRRSSDGLRCNTLESGADSLFAGLPRTLKPYGSCIRHFW